MACGAGLPILALAVTGGHFVIVFAFPHIASRLPKSRWTPSLLQICYHDGREVLREVLIKCTQHNFAVSQLQVEKEPPSNVEEAADRTITVALELQGTGSISKLASKLADIDGVVSVNAGDVNVVTD
jgi:putative Mg2+ transporter-C (MgtC) family protein